MYFTLIYTKSQTDVNYTDFEKTFDKVSHNLLLAKLEKVGIIDPQPTWIKSVLLDRNQAVKYNNYHTSKSIKVTTGVPARSPLITIIFPTFIFWA